MSLDIDRQTLAPAQYRVKGGRPALSCTQKDVWSYNGTRFKNIYELTSKANIDFPDAWAAKLRMDFGLPRIIDMINLAGSSSLASSIAFVGGRFSAEDSSIERDMTRLFAATWISSAYAFRNMLLVSNQQNITNAALKLDGRPQDGVGLFIVSTPQAATLRISVLVTIPVLLGVFIMVKVALNRASRRNGYKMDLLAGGAYLFITLGTVQAFPNVSGVERSEASCLEDAYISAKTSEHSKGETGSGKGTRLGGNIHRPAVINCKRQRIEVFRRLEKGGSPGSDSYVPDETPTIGSHKRGKKGRNEETMKAGQQLSPPRPWGSFVVALPADEDTAPFVYKERKNRKFPSIPLRPTNLPENHRFQIDRMEDYS
ncbi:hypothetical protein C7212DRAFT_363804 [Tuber magnatum]|uniref:Uncharacterized protein n=1 Tax=Tuber magnatum TaxID=42249 RepID=A0A317SQW9_9PEZI|nr:hypothetical protein C7212DRAFT_363804 [Tuber magnatum]